MSLRRRPYSLLVAVVTAVVLTCGTGQAAAKRAPRAATPSPALFNTDYTSLGNGNSLVPVWAHEQEPAAPSGSRYNTRISARSMAPGSASDRLRPDGGVMRVELRSYDDLSRPGLADGDVTISGGVPANRAEVYDRIATHGTPLSKWPDPLDSTRWYGVSIFIPSDFPTTTDTSKWIDLMQWKGLDGGSPPIALEVSRTNFVLGGHLWRKNLGPLNPGHWTRLVFGITWSADPLLGSATAWYNGTQVLPRTLGATMERVTTDGISRVDPNYLKQGIYRSQTWTQTHVVFFGPTTIATTQAGVSN